MKKQVDQQATYLLPYVGHFQAILSLSEQTQVEMTSCCRRSDSFSGRFLSCALAFASGVTVSTWQLTLCRGACAERCIRRDNEQRTPTRERGNYSGL